MGERQGRRGRTAADCRVHGRDQQEEQCEPLACRHRAAAEWADRSEIAAYQPAEAESADRSVTADGPGAGRRDEAVLAHGAA